MSQFQFMVVLHRTAIINFIAHRYGIRPYNKLIAPTFNKLATYLSLGEGYHNFHHTFPYDYTTGEYSWKENFNVSTLFIDIFAYFGWAYDLRRASKDSVEKRKARTGEKCCDSRTKNVFLDYLIGGLVYTWIFWVVFIKRYFF